MHESHRRTLEKLRDYLEKIPSNQALILYGSVARGAARKESDIDFILLTSNNEYERQLKTGNLAFSISHLCVEPCREANGIIKTLGILQEAAQKGTDISRYVFVDSKIVFSKIKGLDKIIQEITTYPTQDITSKLESFYSQVKMHHSYLEYGEYSNNLFVLHQTAVALVLFGGRMILSHNKMFYPGRKWFLSQLKKAPKKPEGFMSSIKALLQVPSIENSLQFCKCLFDYRDWPKPKEGWQNRFEIDMSNRAWNSIN